MPGSSGNRGKNANTNYAGRVSSGKQWSHEKCRSKQECSAQKRPYDLHNTLRKAAVLAYCFNVIISCVCGTLSCAGLKSWSQTRAGEPQRRWDGSSSDGGRRAAGRVSPSLRPALVGTPPLRLSQPQIPRRCACQNACALARLMSTCCWRRNIACVHMQDNFVKVYFITCDHCAMGAEAKLMELLGVGARLPLLQFAWRTRWSARPRHPALGACASHHQRRECSAILGGGRRRKRWCGWASGRSCRCASLRWGCWRTRCAARSRRLF